MATVPKCLALVICEHVHQELNGNLSLLSMFDQVQPSYFPWPLRFVAFALFTNAHEPFPLRIRLVPAREAVGDPDSPCLTHAAGTIEAKGGDPLATYSATVLMAADLREPGDYFVEVFAAGDYVAARRIRVFAPPSATDAPASDA